MGNSGRKKRLFAEYIFSFIYKLHQKAWNSSTRSKKTIDNNKIKKKKKMVLGLIAKQLCLSIFLLKLTECSSLLGGKVLDSFALFSSEMSHKKGKGPSSSLLKVQSN